MFVAGVELDLALLRAHRRSAVMFGVLTFAFPMVFGTVAGVLLGWEAAAALLLGSLLASHTLVLYPADPPGAGWRTTRSSRAPWERRCSPTRSR